MTYREFVDHLASKVWGFTPFRQVKPVHFANAFFRTIVGRHADITLLRNAGAGFRTGRRKLTTEQFVEEISGRYYYALGDVLPVERADQLRTAIDLVLNQDDAFFAGGPYATATLTHAAHISSDPSDGDTGKFMAQVLFAFKDAELLDELSSVMFDDSDNIYTLTLPLLKEMQTTFPRDKNRTVEKDIETRLSESGVLRSVCKAFSTAVLYRSRLEKTLFLQRIVTLGCFAIYLYTINRANEIRNDGLKVPILMVSPNGGPEVREASRATYVRARQQIERAFELGLRSEMENRGEDSLSADGYRGFVARLLNNGQDSDYKKAWDWFVSEYSDNLIASDDPFEAFLGVFTQMTFLFDRTSPPNFAQYLGRLMGLIYPREGGRGLKYYRPTPSFLDMLSVSLLRPEEEVTADEFWERAWREFGVISGYRSTFDVEYLATWGIRQTSISQLRQNGHEMIQELKRMGLADEYADDVTIIRVKV